MKKAAGVLLFLLGLAIAVNAQQRISGTVRSTKDGSAISGVSVVVKGTT